jgi:hypothetical protein
MKLLMMILLVVLMVGVTPAFAADSSADQQTVTSTAVKETNSDIGDELSVTDQSDDIVADPSEDSGYIDEYDDNGDYIGNYIVVDSSDASDISEEDGDYSDELNEDNDTVIDLSDVSDQSNEVNDDYSDELDEINDEFEPGDIDQLDESFDDSIDELGEGNYTVIDSNDQSGTISQIDTDIPTDIGEPILVTLVNELCGVVRSTLEGVDTICAVLGNELEMIL